MLNITPTTNIIIPSCPSSLSNITFLTNFTSKSNMTYNDITSLPISSIPNSPMFTFSDNNMSEQDLINREQNMLAQQMTL